MKWLLCLCSRISSNHHISRSNEPLSYYIAISLKSELTTVYLSHASWQRTDRSNFSSCCVYVNVCENSCLTASKLLIWPTLRTPPDITSYPVPIYVTTNFHLWKKVSLLYVSCTCSSPFTVWRPTPQSTLICFALSPHTHSTTWVPVLLTLWPSLPSTRGRAGHLCLWMSPHKESQVTARV